MTNNNIPCPHCKEPRGSNTKCVGCNLWTKWGDSCNQHECQKCKKFVKHSDFHGPYLSFSIGVCCWCHKELEDEEWEKEAEKERLKKEAKEQAEKDKDDKPETPKEPENKCEFCKINNAEVKFILEREEYQVCKSCYDLHDKSGDDKDNNRERERERERESKIAPLVARIQF